MNRHRQENEERTDFEFHNNCIYCISGVTHANRAHWHCIKRSQKARELLSQRRREVRQVAL